MPRGNINSQPPQRARSGLTPIALATAVLAISAPAALHAQVGHTLTQRTAPMSAADMRAIAESATPATPMIEAVPGAELGHPGPASEQLNPDPGPPGIREGRGARVQRFRIGPEHLGPEGQDDAQMPELEPLDYGVGDFDSVYQYNDYFPRPLPARFRPARSVGRYFFSFDGGSSWSWCTASLINRSMLLTAGHCVHQGGNEEQGWITDGYFIPAFSDRQNDAGDHYGRCDLLFVNTTDQWYSEGNLLDGYDVALGVCDRSDRGPNAGGLIAWGVGWLGFCYENCRWPYLQAMQFGYPGNYYGGGEMTVSNHLNESVSGEARGHSTVDFVYGSGMEGGSSGGPHVVNPFQMDEDSSAPGQFPYRNIAFAVTSWGFTNPEIKMQGASPLSGVNNENNFIEMHNQACTRSRQLVGNNSCPLEDRLSN